MGSSYYIRECCPFVCWRHWFSTILTGPHAGSLSFTSDRFSLGATPRRPRPGPPPGHGAAPTPLRPTAQSHICDGLGPLTRLLKPHHCTSMGLPATPASGDASPAHSPCACGQHHLQRCEPARIRQGGSDDTALQRPTRGLSGTASNNMHHQKPGPSESLSPSGGMRNFKYL
jgi:hypothetical protein